MLLVLQPQEEQKDAHPNTMETALTGSPCLLNQWPLFFLQAELTCYGDESHWGEGMLHFREPVV